LYRLLEDALSGGTLSYVMIALGAFSLFIALLLTITAWIKHQAPTAVWLFMPSVIATVGVGWSLWQMPDVTQVVSDFPGDQRLVVLFMNASFVQIPAAAGFMTASLVLAASALGAAIALRPGRPSHRTLDGLAAATAVPLALAAEAVYSLRDLQYDLLATPILPPVALALFFGVGRVGDSDEARTQGLAGRVTVASLAVLSVLALALARSGLTASQVLDVAAHYAQGGSGPSHYAELWSALGTSVVIGALQTAGMIAAAIVALLRVAPQLATRRTLGGALAGALVLAPPVLGALVFLWRSYALVASAA